MTQRQITFPVSNTILPAALFLSPAAGNLSFFGLLRGFALVDVVVFLPDIVLPLGRPPAESSSAPASGGPSEAGDEVGGKPRNDDEVVQRRSEGQAAIGRGKGRRYRMLPSEAFLLATLELKAPVW